MVSTSAGMEQRTDFESKHIVFFDAWKSDSDFGAALRVRPMFPVLLYDLSLDGLVSCACGSRNEPGWNGMRRHVRLPLIKREFSNNLSRHCQELIPAHQVHVCFLLP
jgi:hypothetical protein